MTKTEEFIDKARKVHGDKYDVDTCGFTDDCTKWHSDYYPIEEWFECKVLTANVDKPCVIMEDGYSE
jgi:hypothetical protein